MSMLVDLSLVLVLVAFNGVFAMAEIAILSARRVRLAQLAERPVRGAARALALSRDPTRFLSTIQAGLPRCVPDRAVWCAPTPTASRSRLY